MRREFLRVGTRLFAIVGSLPVREAREQEYLLYVRAYSVGLKYIYSKILF